MTAYTPPAAAGFADGQSFKHAGVETGFTDLATAINGAVNSANLLNAEYIARCFHDAALRETFRSSTGQDYFVFLVPVNTGVTNIVGPYTNLYDPENCALSFYLRAAANVRFIASVAILKGKMISGTWPTALNTITADVRGVLVIDGVASTAIRATHWTTAAGTATNRGLNVELDHYEAAMAAGRHTAHVRLDFTNSTCSAGPGTLNVLQLMGTHAGLIAHAIYK